MKILIIHNHYLESGGEDGVVAAEIAMLKRFGHQVIFYERSNKEIEDYSWQKKMRLAIKEMVWSQSVYNDIRELVRAEKPDIAHLHNIFTVISPSVYYALKEENIPMVQALHNYRLICPNGVFYRQGKICEECTMKNMVPAVIHKCWRNSRFLTYFLVRALKKHIEKRVFHEMVDCYIALSNFSKNKFVRAGLPAEKIRIKSNFAEISAAKRNNMRDYALFVGRLVDYKGVEDLVLAFKELNHCKLKIIGDGPLLKSLERDIQGVKNIELLGKLPYDKTIEYIRRSRFVVFPSRCYENMPRIIVESFACGVPVLASNLGAAGEMIADNETGLLFAPRDRKDLEVKIKYMLAEPEDVLRMGKNARKVYEERYTAEVNYRLLMNIYDSLKEKMSCKIKG